jgi:hypothetical protein
LYSEASTLSCAARMTGPTSHQNWVACNRNRRNSAGSPAISRPSAAARNRSSAREIDEIDRVGAHDLGEASGQPSGVRVAEETEIPVRLRAVIATGAGAVQHEHPHAAQRGIMPQRGDQLVRFHGGEGRQGSVGPVQPTPASEAASALSRRIEVSGITAQVGRLRVS